jgi:hypothetical protein
MFLGQSVYVLSSLQSAGNYGPPAPREQVINVIRAAYEKGAMPFNRAKSRFDQAAPSATNGAFCKLIGAVCQLQE